MTGFQRVFKPGLETVADLLSLGVERAITLWPEWGVAFTNLDKRVENRPMKPPKNLIGKRVAFHMGAYVGGRKGNPAHIEGLESLTGTAKAAGWDVGRMVIHRGPAWIRLTKDGRQVDIDTRWNPLGEGRPCVEGAVGIVTSAITFTGIISGYTPPTDTPTMPWQIRSDPNNPESWSYAWHIEDVVPLAKPIPGAGIQGFWPLSRLVKS